MSSLAIIKDDRYLEHNPGDGHPESPDRLRVIHDLIAKEFSDLPLIEPRVATEDELAAVHDPFYIQTVANTEGRAFSRLDADTGVSARSYRVARLAAGGLLNAVDSLLTPQSALKEPPLPYSLALQGRGAGVRVISTRNQFSLSSVLRAIMPNPGAAWVSASSTTSPSPRNTPSRSTA